MLGLFLIRKSYQQNRNGEESPSMSYKTDRVQIVRDHEAWLGNSHTAQDLNLRPPEPGAQVQILLGAPDIVSLAATHKAGPYRTVVVASCGTTCVATTGPMTQQMVPALHPFKSTFQVFETWKVFH